MNTISEKKTLNNAVQKKGLFIISPFLNRYFTKTG